MFRAPNPQRNRKPRNCRQIVNREVTIEQVNVRVTNNQMTDVIEMAIAAAQAEERGDFETSQALQSILQFHQ